MESTERNENKEKELHDDSFYQQIAKTYHGLEELLADEIRELGGADVLVLNRAVSYTGDDELMYKVNLHSRTALAVLVPIETFKAEDPEDLYEKAMKVEWENYFSCNDSFAIHHSINSDFFTHSQFAALKLKDAIVDRFRKVEGRRPSVDKENPQFRINIHIFKQEVTLSFDSSGEPLFKRGYRQRQSQAPLNEILAAGMIMFSGWKGEKTFIDPMCGSGTLPIEAAMIAMKIPAGWYRRRFGFMNWNNYDESLWNRIKDEAREKILKQPPHLIIGSDILSENIDKCERNAHLIRCNQLKFAVRDFFDFQRPDNEAALVMINPPYGERLDNEPELENFYKAIGDEFKKKFTGCDAWLISSNTEAIKKIGLKADQKITLYNGPLECKLLHFPLFEGSQKEKQGKVNGN
ncbi:MAG: class I SAM-dependent RNA methyltransferase [Flavobacteriales bacterium]